MTAIGQILTLLSGANGDAVGTGQWFGGKAFAFVSASGGFNVKFDISPDGGTTWVQVNDIQVGAKDLFSSPALMVRARGQGPSSPQNLNVTLIGYDQA